MEPSHHSMTMGGHLTRLRICQAQYLLISTDWGVSRIAFETGFESLSRFYGAFKGVSGRMPRRYRLLSDMH